MPSGEKWVGKPPSKGNQEKAMSIFRESPEQTFTVREIMEMIDAPEGTVTGVLSDLRAAGWLTHPMASAYKLATPAPREDRSNIYWSENGAHPRKNKKDSDRPFEIGEDYIVKCIAYDSKGSPVIQKDDDSRLFRVSEV
jgi:hypothetical protein